jgi:hypothetical protein
MGAFDVVANIVIPDPEDAAAAAAFRKKWKWEAHETVIIRGQFTTAMQEACENASSAFTGKTAKSAAAEARLGSGKRKMLEMMIVDWTFAEGGRKVAVSSATIGRLPANYRKPILDACDEIAEGMTEEEQEDFLPNANGHSSASSDEMNLSPSLS